MAPWHRVRFFFATLFLTACSAFAQTTPPIRVAIVGLVHGHVQGFLHNLSSHPEITLVGIAEPDAALRRTYIDRTHLPESLFFASEAEMLQSTHPQAILVYTSIAGHRAAIEQAAPLHIAAMVEKPLATTYEDALAMQRLSAQYHVPVLTNYETTWYASNTAAYDILSSGKIGDVRKLVVHDGHRGPKEIGVGPEFLSWLTDPKQNGGGALFDFGCYGVDLATWFMHGELPLTVTAVALHIKPEVYPNVDDDSTIVLTYPHSQAIIQGSWNWPFDRKDMEVYGAKGYVDTVYLNNAHGDNIRLRLPGETSDHTETAPPLTAPHDNSLNYLAAVLSGKLQPQHDLTSLDTNVTVVRILDAARRSAETGQTIHLADEVAANPPLSGSTLADKVLVLKGERKLLLMKDDQVLKTYTVSLGGNPVGPKIEKGDHKTPEGNYVLDRHNAHSQYHKSIHISYPNDEDAERAKKFGVSAGGNLFIHGMPNDFKGPGDDQGDWTDGCIAVTNAEIDEIWRMVADGTPIEIRP